MYPRDIRISDPAEAMIVEQALAMYREARLAAHGASDGTVIDVAESLVVAKGRELTRKTLEAVLRDQADSVEKKGLPAEPARAVDRGNIAENGRARSSRRRGR